MYKPVQPGIPFLLVELLMRFKIPHPPTNIAYSPNFLNKNR